MDSSYGLLPHQVARSHPDEEELMVKYGHDKAPETK